MWLVFWATSSCWKSMPSVALGVNIPMTKEDFMWCQNLVPAMGYVRQWFVFWFTICCVHFPLKTWPQNDIIIIKKKLLCCSMAWRRRKRRRKRSRTWDVSDARRSLPLNWQLRPMPTRMMRIKVNSPPCAVVSASCRQLHGGKRLVYFHSFWRQGNKIIVGCDRVTGTLARRVKKVTLKAVLRRNTCCAAVRL